MDLKYTIEILTKDIQDIEKLVAGIQNSTSSSTLELDLAMSKLRNVYDVLASIREDMPLGRVKMEAPPVPAAEPRTQTAPEPVVPAPEPEPAKPEPVVPAPEPEPAKPEPVVPEPVVPAPEPEPEPVPPKPEPEVKSKADENRAEAETPTKILADTFSGEASINENLANSREGALENKLAGKPIESISRNIGINDRFMIIRELYEGDSEAFGKLIGELDQAGSLGTALEILEHATSAHKGHEGVGILANLVHRRYAL